MSAQDVRVSVVVSAYSEARWGDLRDCLLSLSHQSLIPDDIILVVDHNPDLLRMATTELSSIARQVTVVDSDQPRGLAGARNAGVGRARGDVIVFIDDDAVADIHWLAELLLAFGDADVGMVAGNILPRWPALVAPKWFPKEFLWVVGAVYSGMRTDGLRNPIGASMAVRSNIVAELGGFDTSMGETRNLSSRCDETELAIRAHKIFPGMKVAFAARSVVIHSVTSDRTRFGYFVRRCATEGRSKALFDISDLSIEGSYLGACLGRALGEKLMRGVLGSSSELSQLGAILTGTFIAGLAFVGTKTRLFVGKMLE